MKNEFWLIFRDSPHNVSRRCKAGFQHVFILMKDSFNWILVNPTSTQLDIRILGYETNEYVPSIFMKNPRRSIHIVRVVTYDKEASYWRVPFNVGCMGQVKYITNIKGIFFTPYQLYKKLVKGNNLTRFNIYECEKL